MRLRTLVVLVTIGVLGVACDKEPALSGQTESAAAEATSTSPAATTTPREPTSPPPVPPSDDLGTGPAPGSGTLPPGTKGFSPTWIRWPVPVATERPEGFGASFSHEWLTREMTGDEFPDFVVTGVAIGTTYKVVTPFDATSAPHWRVYPGSASGFALEAKKWALPAAPAGLAWHELTAANSAYLDVNNDKLLDLVVTGRVDPYNPTVPPLRNAGGAPIWKVYRATTSGFEADPVDWELPESYAPGSISDVNTATFDIDGDGKLDLIQYGEGYGAPINPWRVYLGRSGGFQNAATAWRVPTPGPVMVDGSWMIFDLVGDEKRELLQTGSMVTGPIDPTTGMQTMNLEVVKNPSGMPVWRIHAVEDMGFGTATDFAVPTGWGPGGFASVHMIASATRFTNGTSIPTWWTYDIDGDGSMELVDNGATTLNLVCAKWVDEDGDYWRVYERGTGGFERSFTKWRLPDVELSDCNTPEYSTWSASDINGDRVVDLYLSGRWGQTELGTERHVFRDGEGDYWKVYLGQR